MNIVLWIGCSFIWFKARAKITLLSFLWEFDTQVTGTRSLMSLFPLVLWYFSTHDYCTVQDRISPALARDIRCALAMACVWWFGQEMLGSHSILVRIHLYNLISDSK